MAVPVQVGDRGLPRVVARLDVVRHTEVVAGEDGRTVVVRAVLGTGHHDHVEVLRVGVLVHQIGVAVAVEVGIRGRVLAHRVDRTSGSARAAGHRARAVGREEDEIGQYRHHDQGGRHGVPYAQVAEDRTACCRKVHQPTSRAWKRPAQGIGSLCYGGDARRSRSPPPFSRGGWDSMCRDVAGGVVAVGGLPVACGPLGERLVRVQDLVERVEEGEHLGLFEPGLDTGPQT